MQPAGSPRGLPGKKKRLQPQNKGELTHNVHRDQDPSMIIYNQVSTDDIFSETYLHKQGLWNCSLDSSDDSLSYISNATSYDIELLEDEEKTSLQKKYKIPKPRILRNDFRRFYANMWVNVFNSGDQALVNQHLQTFYALNVGVVQADLRYDRVVHPLEIPMYQERAQGRGYLGKFWYAGMCIAPDVVCSLRHTMLKVRSDGTSAIKCAFVLKGTMVANLNDAKKEDVEKIARYQKLRDSGRTDIRDITFTEAAMVAVAPPTIVAVPGGRAEVLSNTTPKQPKEQKESKEPKELKETTTTSHKPAESNRETSIPMQLSCDSMDSSATSEDNASTSSDASSSMLSASPTTARSPPLLSSHTQASARKRSHISITQVKTEPGTGSSSVESIANKKAHTNNTSASIRQATGVPSDNHIDWMAVAEGAFQAGVLTPCLPHSAKEYYHDEEPPAVCAADLLHQHRQSTVNTNSTGSTSSASSPSSTESSIESDSTDTAMEVESEMEVCDQPPSLTCTPTPSLPPEPTEELVPAAPVGKKIVLTAKIDCICSLELELDKDSVIVGLAVNYFR